MLAGKATGQARCAGPAIALAAGVAFPAAGLVNTHYGISCAGYECWYGYGRAITGSLKYQF
jgi:hypothetical protein